MFANRMDLLSAIIGFWVLLFNAVVAVYDGCIVVSFMNLSLEQYEYCCIGGRNDY